MSARALSPEKLATARKAKGVHKVLHEDGFRKATEASWNKHSSEVQSLDILTRCKKLNQFLAQGLLGEVDDEVLELLSQSGPGRPAAVQRALARTLQKPQQSSPQKQSSELEKGREATGSPSMQPLRSRITAKETAALLELLHEEGEPQGSNNTQVSSTGHGEPDATGGLHTAASSAPAATAAADEDLDIVGLINQPAAADSTGPVESATASVADLRSVLQQLRREQAEQASIRLQSAVRCKQARQLLHTMKQQAQVQQQLHNHLLAQQQQPQQRLSGAGNAQESVSQAWDGYYKYWGAHAASVIQRHWRSYIDRVRYKQQRSAAIVLQAYVRGWHCRQSPDNPLPAHRQSMQQRLLQQQLQEQDRKHRQAAAVSLQCCVRGWKARRRLQQLLHEAHVRAQINTNAEAASAHAAELALCRLPESVAASDQQVATNTAATVASEPVAVRHAGTVIPDSSDNSKQHVYRPESSSSTSSGGSSSDVTSEQDSSQQAAGVQEVHMHHKHRKHRQPELHRKEGRQQPEDNESRRKQRCNEDSTTSQPMPAGQKQDQQNTARSSISPVCRPGAKDSNANSSNGPLTNADALLARQLLIRNAAETRTATQHGDTEMPGYRTGLVGDLVQRVGELSAGESLQAASLAARVTMAGSSHRGLQEAMTAVKGRRETH